ncbi:Signal recognition particle-docking protein FtsY [Caenorhabditis elegans]|uniref:Signal recognition particle-docking protein FtsY n=1 Tax=Caenorhabditis elegans TaxID=6239 RepID=Q95XA2_CAEEL|nr:Signal recognition particle-docking protein FtsY [Caenorhabditis elegans]CCD66824.1 Signal recognition particle-docking protein FtsY [Caenorhabditis elegans]|eukprot:NP_740916.1 Uncharacterized protein CELE_Y37F4.4 [Caenorhabditis elegans]
MMLQKAHEVLEALVLLGQKLRKEVHPNADEQQPTVPAPAATPAQIEQQPEVPAPAPTVPDVQQPVLVPETAQLVPPSATLFYFIKLFSIVKNTRIC